MITISCTGIVKVNKNINFSLLLTSILLMGGGGGVWANPASNPT